MRSTLRQHAVPLLLAAAGAVFVGQGVGLFLGQKTLNKAKGQLAAKERWLVGLANSAPEPTQAAADVLSRELVELRDAVREAEAFWRDNPIVCALADFPPLPNSRAAYFDLVRYRQALADLAREQGVVVGADEFFGFRAYANEGPEAADIPKIYTQQRVLERVLEPLLRNKPQQLLAVICEEPSDQPELAAQREPEGLPTRQRFQVRFLGTTAVLRAWLNALANSPLPVVVRRVTADPSAERQIVPIRTRYSAGFSSARSAEADDEDGFEPLVRPSGTEFSVTLDYIKLRPDQGLEATAGEGEFSRVSQASPERVVTWTEPEPQDRGPQWGFDVFTPPEIFYHPSRQQFRVKNWPPQSVPTVAGGVSVESRSWHRAPPQLLSVQREDYPLQLSGYIGGGDTSSSTLGDAADSFFGLFENGESGEILLLRGGEQVETLGIDVLDFRMEAWPVADDALTTLRELRAVATVRSAQGEQRTLHQGERAEGYGVIAQIQWEGARVELREGDILACEEGQSFAVTQVQLVPDPRVVMTRRTDTSALNKSPADAPESLVLVLEPQPIQPDSPN